MANYISSYTIDYLKNKQFKYGVINSCDNTTNYSSTTWSVIDNGGIEGLTVDGSDVNGVSLTTQSTTKYLIVTNAYKGTSSDPVITVKASSNLVNCDTNNTCAITLKRACWHQPVIFELEINDDSKGYVTSVTGTIGLGWNVNTTGVGHFGEIEINGIGNYTASSFDLPSNCYLISENNKIYFRFYNININVSLSNNGQNISVNGGVEYKFAGDNYQTLDSLPSSAYTYSSTSNSISITDCNWLTSQLNGLMDGFKTLYIKNIINLQYATSYKFYHQEFFSLEEISRWSESRTINNYHTYSLNEIIEGQLLACAESPNDNFVSASSLTVSNFSSNNSNFTFSSLAINDDDDVDRPGRFYIGVKCNTNSLVNLFNGNNEFSATMTFDLSYSNASIPVTININKVKTTQYEITFTLVVNITDNLPYTYDSCDSGNISYASINYSFSGVEYSSISGSDSWYNNGNNKFTYSFTISSDVESPTINIDFTVNVFRVHLTTPQYEIRVDNDVTYVNNRVPSNCPFGSIYHFDDAMGITGNVNRAVSDGATIDVYIRLNQH